MSSRWSSRSRPSLVGNRSRFIYYPNTAPVAMGACVMIAGRSFSVLAEVDH